MKKEKPESTIRSWVTKKKSMFNFSPLFAFIFSAWPFTTGEGVEKWRGRERAEEKWIASPQTAKVWQVKTQLQVINNVLLVCEIQPFGVPLYLSAPPELMTFLCFISECRILLNVRRRGKPTKSSKVVFVDRHLRFFHLARAGSDFSKSSLRPKRAWRSDLSAQRCAPPTITLHYDKTMANVSWAEANCRGTMQNNYWVHLNGKLYQTLNHHTITNRHPLAACQWGENEQRNHFPSF